MNLERQMDIRVVLVVFCAVLWVIRGHWAD